MIGSSVATIGESAFEDCYKLKSIALECDTPPAIYSDTFSSTAATLYVPSGTKAAYQSASYWKYFKSIVEPTSGTCGTNVSWTFNRGVLTIDGKGAMNNYSSFNAPWYDIQDKIISVIIKDQITSIGNYSFYNCTSLNSITIGNSVTSIGERAFYYCNKLTSITIPNSVTSIGNGAFYGCLALAIVYNNSTLDITSGSSSNGYAGYYAIAILKDTDDIKGNYVFRTTDGTHCLVAYLGNETEIVFPENYNGNDYVIGNRLFYNNKNIVRISIPQGVKSIGEYAFYGCTALQYVNVEHRTPLAIGYSMFYNVAATLYVPYGTKTAYQANYYWSKFTNIEEIVLSEVTVTIGQYGSATYCSPYALDFSEVDGLKVYAATGYKSNSQVVTLTRVQTAEAGVGLFLKGEPGEYIVPVIESTDEHSLNMLVGTLEQTTVNSTDGAMSNYKFTIAEGDTAPMFYPFEDNTTFSAGKAYLQIPTAWLPATAQKSLSVRFDDGETTDIDELKGESGEVKTIYDLQGRVVENPTSGIYIIGGKKVIIK